MGPEPDKRVLVVEDAVNWQRLIGDLLQEVASVNGWTIQAVIVSRFTEARDHITTTSFDCVTVDRQLRDGTMAKPLLDRIGHLTPAVPVVVISGTANPSDVRDYFKNYNVAEFFWKDDFDPEKFRQTLTRLLEQGGDMVQQPRSLGDWLIDTLDLLRHNARNVLIERWEKRTFGKAVTPPAFDDKPRTHEELRSSLPSEDKLLARLSSYRKLDGTTVIVTEQHIRNLREQMTAAQASVDRYNLELSKPLSAAERIPIEHRRDEFQKQINQAVEELADVLAFLYSK